jgi:hypothetical protein
MLAVQGMAQDLSLKYDKQFVIDGITTKPPVVVYLGLIKGVGPVYADPTNGRVIRDRYSPPNNAAYRDNIHSITQAEYLTESYSLAFGGHRQPFCRSAALAAGLITPMSAEAKALVRLLVLPLGLNPEALKYETALPNLDDLEKALGLMVPHLMHDPSYRPNMIPIQHELSGVAGTFSVPAAQAYTGPFTPAAQAVAAPDTVPSSQHCIADHSSASGMGNFAFQHGLDPQLLNTALESLNHTPPCIVDDSESEAETGPAQQQPRPIDNEAHADHDDNDNSVTYATTELLNNHIGVDLISFMPGLDQVIFRTQRDPGRLPVRLAIGNSAENGYHVVFVPTLNRKVAPTMSIVKTLPRKGGTNTRLKAEDVSRERFNQLLEKPRKYFVEPFASAHNHVEFTAAAKYCFILAEEAKLLGVKERMFPINASFENNLKRLCQRLRAEAFSNPSAIRSERDTGESSSGPSGVHHPRSVHNAGSRREPGSTTGNAPPSIPADMGDSSLDEGALIAPTQRGKRKANRTPLVAKANRPQTVPPPAKRRKQQATRQSEPPSDSEDDIPRTRSQRIRSDRQLTIMKHAARLEQATPNREDLLKQKAHLVERIEKTDTTLRNCKQELDELMDQSIAMQEVISKREQVLIQSIERIWEYEEEIKQIDWRLNELETGASDNEDAAGQGGRAGTAQSVVPTTGKGKGKGQGKSKSKSKSKGKGKAHVAAEEDTVSQRRDEEREKTPDWM